MRFQEKLRKYSKKELWDEYCGFLTLKPEEFMRIQRRLLQEQMELWSSSALGQSILKGKYPRTIEEFRQIVPLTTYEDYAPLLLSRQAKSSAGGPCTLDSDYLGGRRASLESGPLYQRDAGYVQA